MIEKNNSLPQPPKHSLLVRIFKRLFRKDLKEKGTSYPLR